MGDFHEKPHFTKKVKISGGCKVGAKNFCSNVPKGTPLRQIWSNKSFSVYDSDFVLTLYGGEKKVRENRHWKSRVVYNTTSLPRRRHLRSTDPTTARNTFCRPVCVQIHWVHKRSSHHFDPHHLQYVIYVAICQCVRVRL